MCLGVYGHKLALLSRHICLISAEWGLILKTQTLLGFEVPVLVTRGFAGLAALATLTVIFQSLSPVNAVPSVTHMDKVVHFLAYGILAGFWVLGLPRRSFLQIVGVLVALGIALEIGQHIMDLGRTGSIWDALANSFGAALGGFLALFLQRTPSLKSLARNV